MIRVLWTWGMALVTDVIFGWVNNFRIRTPEVRPMTATVQTARHMGDT